MKQVRVGFIGAGGFISANHLLTARDSEIMEIRAIADIDKDRLKNHASRMTIGYTTTDYRKLLIDPDVDIIVIGTKQNLHARFIMESLDAGKWVFCEKPMAETQEETQAVLSAEQRNPGELAIGFNRRFAPAYVRAKELMQMVEKPWLINYRLVYPNPQKHDPNNFYHSHERILYEGCHILDVVCWLLDDKPHRVFMSGDRYLNNCCILEYPDGSQVSFMCGSMNNPCLWKEYMEVFGVYTGITISDFVDMRVRGFKGQHDAVFPPYLREHVDAIMEHGFNFYEAYKAAELMRHPEVWSDIPKMQLEQVKRPTPYTFDVSKYAPVNPDLWSFVPDKGIVHSFEHFARCRLTGAKPRNADGQAGGLSTAIALGLLESLETAQAVDMTHYLENLAT